MKNLVKHVLISISIFGVISCGYTQTRQQSAVVADNYESAYSAEVLNDNLETAFKQNSADALRSFFIKWNEQVKPNTAEFIEQNDTIEAVFSIYKEFYKPLDLLKLGSWEWGNKLNSNCKYVVVQNKIFYSVIPSDNIEDSDGQTLYRDSLINFRPPLNLDSKKVLYLTVEYDKSLNKFLGRKSTEIGTPNIMNPSRPVGESKKRYEMIRPFIPVLHGHWGGYWHSETHPDVSNIVLNNSLTKARVNFRVGYEGGEATLEKKGKEWIIKKSEATWIE